MQTRLCKEDQEPMLKQEFSFDGSLMYHVEEDYEAFIKVEKDESIKQMILSENWPQKPPSSRQRWRDNAIVLIERLPEYDRIFQAKHTRKANLSSSPPVSPMSNKRADAIINPYISKSYCRRCGKSYPDLNFDAHLRNVHGLRAERPKSTHAIRKPYTTPKHQNRHGSKRNRKAMHFNYPHATIDPRHPQNYCAKCDRTYHKKYFRKHLRILHGLQDEDFKPSIATSKNTAPRINRGSQDGRKAKHFKNPQANTDPLKPQQYCAKCNRTYSTASFFRLHLKRAHGTTTPSIKYPNTEINIFHPNNYCAKCDKRYESANLFFNHLQDSHISTLYNIRSTVNISNKRGPAYYCPKCDRYYTEEIFRQHFVKHRRSSKLINMNPNAEIDLNSPDLYCSKCEHYFSKKSLFGRHVTFEHGLGYEWSHAKRQKKVVYPDAEIDFFNTDGYCAKCDKKLSSKGSLWAHAAAIHALYPPSIGGKPLDLGACNLRNGKKLIPVFK